MVLLRAIIPLLCAALAAFAPQAANARAPAPVITTGSVIGSAADPVVLTYTEHDDANSDDASEDGEIAVESDLNTDAEAEADTGSTQRFVPMATILDRPTGPVIARYGPFHLISPTRVEMIGAVDSATPRQFAAMLAAHPGLRELVMIDCPGSVDEEANHALARAVRRAGLATHVPDGASIRSGAVELWLAGSRRTAGEAAEFGIHSWRDEDGREARSVAANDPVHADYIRFYREMGLDERTARRFYALSNSVGFDDVRYLSTGEMRRLGLLSDAG